MVNNLISILIVEIFMFYITQYLISILIVEIVYEVNFDKLSREVSLCLVR